MRGLYFIFAILLCATSYLQPAHGHEGRPIYIELVEQSNGSFSMRWKIPPVMPSNNAPIIHLIGDTCTLQTGITQPQLTGSKLYACLTGDTRLQVALDYRTANPVLSTLILFRRNNDTEFSIITGPEERLITLPAEETLASVAAQYTTAGFDHILEGYDHLLFVFCLVLLVGGFKRTLIAVTGFTIGHSITLGMSALAQWSLPPTFVEPLIAFSVLMLAVERAKGDKSTFTYRYPILVAASFGLLHGFGFGGALAELGLPQTLQVQALGFFNVGVELGQALFVLSLFMLAAIVKKAAAAVAASFDLQTYEKLAIYPAGILASFWTIERVIGIWA